MRKSWWRIGNQRGSVLGKQMEWSGELSRHRTQCQGQEPGGHCGHRD